MLKFLLIVWIFLIPFSEQKCTADEEKKIEPCLNMKLLEKMQNVRIGVTTSDTLKEISSECNEMVECVGDVKCTSYIDNIVKSCQSMDVLAELVPCFMDIIKNLAQVAGKYPCLRENGLISSDSQKSMCKLMKTRKSCFDKITNGICGKKFNSGKVDQFATGIFKCAA